MTIKRIGGDFEFHLYNLHNNQIVPAEKIINVDRNAYIAAETTTLEIRPTAVDNISKFMQETRELINEAIKVAKNNNLGLTLAAANLIYEDLNFDWYEDKSIEDYNAYLEKTKRTLIEAKNLNKKFRTQGGHIWLPITDDVVTRVKLLDIFLGCGYVYMFPSHAELLRRQKYGQAGSYRVHDSLYEYRVLSSELIRTPELFKNTLEIALYLNTVNLDSAKKFIKIVERYYDIPNIINNCDGLKALCLLDSLKNNEAICEKYKKFTKKWYYFVRYMGTQIDTNRLFSKDLTLNWFLK